MNDSRSTPSAEALRPGLDVLENEDQTVVQVAVVTPLVDDDRPEDGPHGLHILGEYRKEDTSLVARFGAPYWEA
jgi:hypothetical protein